MLSRTQRVAIHTVETAYRQARDGQSPWMQEVLSAVRPLLDAGRGVLAGVPVSRLLPGAGLDDLLLVASTEMNTDEDRATLVAELKEAL